tara:strand:+ start:750 stop:920 length:171 start_codon:yes stop_codon:yes gene_type:complete
MRIGDLVRFREYDYDIVKLGLLLRYDRVLKVGEIMCGDRVYYAPGRLIETHQRGIK